VQIMRIALALLMLIVVLAAPVLLVTLRRTRSADSARAAPQVWDPADHDAPADPTEPPAQHNSPIRPDGRAIPGSRPDRRRHGKP
jgi:hypothetical protein